VPGEVVMGHHGRRTAERTPAGPSRELPPADAGELVESRARSRLPGDGGAHRALRRTRGRRPLRAYREGQCWDAVAPVTTVTESSCVWFPGALVAGVGAGLGCAWKPVAGSSLEGVG
jgi:hypothetical protein